MKTNVSNVLTKSGSRFDAHNAVVCTGRKQEFSDLEILFGKYKRNIFVNPDIAFLLELQMLYGLRVSEALKLAPCDYVGHGVFRAKTDKGGKNRMIRIVYNMDYIRSGIIYKLPLIDRYNRFYVYRVYKKIGIFKRYNSNKYQSVTHFFRHEIVKEMKRKNIDNETITSFMGWRSEKTILYYE